MIILRLCAHVQPILGKDTEKKSAQRLFAGLFLFEVYYCPMLFSKNLINVTCWRN